MSQRKVTKGIYKEVEMMIISPYNIKATVV